MKNSTTFLFILLLLLSAGRLSAQKITFTPHRTAQAQFAGYYVAREKGFYEEYGLEVEIEHPTSTRLVVGYIVRGQSQVITMPLCQAMQMIGDGWEFVNILQTSMNNALVIVSGNDENPVEQKGIRVGTWSAGFDQIAFCMSLKERLEYEWIPIASSTSSLLITGAIDAVMAMSYDDYYILKQSGIRLTDDNVYRFSEHDYNVQDDGVYMTRSFYENNKDVARRFAEASKKGWEWAAEHPEETLDIVMEYVAKDHIATNRTLQRLQLQEVLRLQLDRESGQREFRLRPDMVSLACRLMKESQLLLNEVTYEDIIAK